MANVPFYAQGLKFSCKRCSACCRFESGYVYLSENDLKKLTRLTDMDDKSFIGSYCRWVMDPRGNKVLSLREKQNKDCIFWESECMIYEARPLQCSTFPFWESNVSSEYNWDAAAAGCPGINSGKLYSNAEITRFLKLRSSEPLYCKGEK